MIELKGIDISRHNIIKDWKEVAKHIDFAIIRAGGNFGGFYKDPKFEINYNACKMYNVPCGAYYDVGKLFIGSDTGKEYAQHFKKLLSGYTFEYPVYADIEVTPKKFKKQITEAAISFCEEMEKDKFYVGIYGSDISTFHDALILDDVRRFTLWVARYGNKPKLVKDYAIWQYSSKGSVPGIVGPVDMDICRVDFPKVMKGVHLNGN